MAAFNGSWESGDTENIDAYCEVLSVPADVRDLMKAKHSVKVSNVGDKWTYISTMGGKENEIVLTVGAMGDYKTPTGIPLKGIIKSVSDNKMVEEHFMGDFKVDTVREIVNGAMVATLTVKGVTAKMTYNKK